MIQLTNLTLSLSLLSPSLSSLPPFSPFLGGVGLLLKSCVVVLVSQIVGILVPIATAVVLQLTGQSMSWFSIPLLAIPLFFLPSLLGIAAVHSWWKNKVKTFKVSTLQVYLFPSLSFPSPPPPSH